MGGVLSGDTSISFHINAIALSLIPCRETAGWPLCPENISPSDGKSPRAFSARGPYVAGVQQPQPSLQPQPPQLLPQPQPQLLPPQPPQQQNRMMIRMMIQQQLPPPKPFELHIDNYLL